MNKNSKTKLHTSKRLQTSRLWLLALGVWSFSPAGFAGPTNNPAPATVSVVTDTNGNLVAPANLFSQNAALLNQAGIAATDTNALHATNNLSDLTNTAVARANLGLGSAATNATAAFQSASSALTNLSVNNGAALTNLNATNLAGTLQAAQFPATLPTASGANLTALPAANLSGTVPAASLPTVIQTLITNNGVNLTNLNAGSLYGVVPASNGGMDSTVINFINSNHITDTSVASDLFGMVSELKASGAWTNLVDGLLFQPRFNPTNQLSLLGNPWSWSNSGVYSSWGAYFNATNQIKFVLPKAITNFTVVYTIREPVSIANVSPGGFLWGIEDTNTGSGDMLSDGGGTLGGSYLSEVIERISGGNINFTNNSSLYNPVHMGGSYAYVIDSWRMNQIRTYGVSSDGGGNITMWEDAIQGKFGLSANQFTYHPGVTNATPMNVLVLGEDYGTNSSVGGVYCPVRFTGEFGDVLLFTNVLSSNQMVSAYRSLWWAETQDTMVYAFGDSLIANQVLTNNDFQFYINRHPEWQRWANYGENGTTIAQMAQYPLTAIASLPYPQKIKRIKVFENHGWNDVFNAGGATGGILQNLTNVFNNMMALGAQVTFLTIEQVWTNNTTYYTSGKAAQANAINAFFYTNGTLGGSNVVSIIPNDQLRTQNLLNTNNGYSLDGIHPFGPSGYVLNQAVADLMDGHPYVVGVSVSNAIATHYPYDAYGNVWLSPMTVTNGVAY